LAMVVVLSLRFSFVAIAAIYRFASFDCFGVLFIVGLELFRHGAASCCGDINDGFLRCLRAMVRGWAMGRGP
jgi:hypothetical protein